MDLYAEFRWFMAGTAPLGGFGILGALLQFGLAAGVSEETKDSMRVLAQKDTFTENEKLQLLNYCEEDVNALGRLLGAMAKLIDLPGALLRGRYMKAAAQIERAGVPIDMVIYNALRENGDRIVADLIVAVDADYGVYDGRTFKTARWLDWCSKNGIQWPLLATGYPKLDVDTFREMSKRHPQILPIKELRVSLAQLHLQGLAICPDGRNRYLLSAFGSKTGRNQPLTSKSVFGPAAWIRSLIKPGPGKALAYLDYEQQEWAIAAVLSHDNNMIEAYISGDPYLTFAIQAGGSTMCHKKKSPSRA